ncbi:WbqC family protein [Halobaculum limi]|uniref:WbqC family protein n=1 Tax=Halobaculum limi TaxID=3031916 RepID=UPI00240492D9|nr:WbqC family protein [Halobaculum sp. YSMS11]
MVTTVTAYQPRYFPRLHYLARAQQADVFIIYDDVEFSRRSRQHRAAISVGESDWLTIPVEHSGTKTRICDATIDMSTPWMSEHIETLVHKYGPRAYAFEPFFESLLLSVPTIEAVRESTKLLRDVVGQEGSSVLDEVLKHDSALQDSEHKVSNLQLKKEALGNQISVARSEGRERDAANLVDSVRALAERLDPMEHQINVRRRQRDQALVELAEYIPANTDVEVLPPESLWDLTGVEPAKVVSSELLVDLTIPLLEELFERFEIDSKVVRSSHVDVEHPGDPSEYLAELTAAFDGDSYLSGKTGYENYVDEAPFTAQNIDVEIQDWEPTWEGGNVCALDVIFSADDPSQFIR